MTVYGNLMVIGAIGVLYPPLGFFALLCYAVGQHYAIRNQNKGIEP
jgi:hypothetical protein